MKIFKPKLKAFAFRKKKRGWYRWFAWRPVITNKGIIWMRFVHRYDDALYGRTIYTSD